MCKVQRDGLASPSKGPRMAPDDREPDPPRPDVPGGIDRLAHDLMTALAVAKGNAQLLRRRSDRLDPTGTIGALDEARLRDGLDRIVAALDAAVGASIALIAHGRKRPEREPPETGGPDPDPPRRTSARR